MAPSRPWPAEARYPPPAPDKAAQPLAHNWSQPRNVALDADGSLYISDFGANQVYQRHSNGILSLVAGTGTAGFSGVGTSALLAQLNAPAGLTVDPSGALYFADSGNNRVRKVYNGVIITVFNTPAPTGVALDSTGMLYVAASSYFGTVVQQIPGIACGQRCDAGSFRQHLRHFGRVRIGDSERRRCHHHRWKRNFARTSAAMAARLRPRNCIHHPASRGFRPVIGTSPTPPTIASAW